MPLTPTGKKILKKMQKKYGKSQGTRIFYAMEHSHPEWTVRGHYRKGGIWVRRHKRRRRK